MTDLLYVAVTILLIAVLARLVALIDERLPDPSPDPQNPNRPTVDPPTVTSQPGRGAR